MKIIFNTYNEQPLIRVCAFQKQEHIDFKFKADDFAFFDMNGKALFPDVKKDKVWRIKIKKAHPARYEHYLILRESQNLKDMEQALEEYKVQDSQVLLKAVGGDIFIGAEEVSSNEKYLIMAGPFSSERQARHHSRNYNQLNHCRIHRQIVEDGRGTIEVYDSEYENFTETKNGVWLRPLHTEAYFQVSHFAINANEEQKIRHEDLFYQGALFIKIDEENSLTAINEISIESYLKGVLYSEIGQQAQLEYAKSMAIAARSQIFARIGQLHANEGFDFCSDSHCLRYYGKNYDCPAIDRAVAETKGLVLARAGKVCHAHFSYSCGGHTENTSGIWLDDDLDYIVGRFDGDEKDDLKLDLTKEKNVRQWIFSRPAVLCRINDQESGAMQKLSVDSFRWEVFYTRNELETIIQDKTGEDVGMIYEIIPISRGVSGRLKEVEILGSLKNVRIAGELNIRSAFSETYLNSSCFIVQPELDSDGIPLNFLFIGAGKGHGVGLCKVGANRMACNGKNHQEILTHYYEQCQIKRIY